MSAEVKVLLKEAREAIGSKKFEDAQELCKKILQKDKHSYMGLVLLGVSLQDSDKAPLIFHKALAVDSGKPLAWQGLATYYEKHLGPDASEKLLSIYKEILQLDIDVTKATEILNKLGLLGVKLKSAAAIDVIFKYLSKATDDTIRKTAESQLLILLKSDVALETSGVDILSIVENLYEAHFEDAALVLNYAKLISKNVEYPVSIEKIIKLKGFSTNILLKQWLCRYIFEEYVSKESFNGWDVKIYLEDIIYQVDTVASSFLKCVALYDSGIYNEAFEIAKKLLDLRKTDETLVRFIVKCTSRLSNWLMTERIIATAVPNINNIDTLKDLHKALLLACARQEKWAQGVKVGRQLQSDVDLNSEQSYLLGQCLIHENQNVDDLLDSLRGTDHYDPLLAWQHIKNNELKEAKDVLEKSHSNASARWLNLGIVYWKLKEHAKSLVPLLKATKLDPGQSKSFLYLGHYYNEHVSDLEKAKKCYLKAFALNNYSSEAARSLSGAYRELGETEANYELMKKVSSTLDQSEYWPKLQLGLFDLSQQRWDDAIRNFRTVIRVAPSDVTAWESLADAYYSRRSFTSALKCYNKVIELRPNETIYPETRVGSINHVLGLYSEAVGSYESVLRKDPHCLIALKGLAETLKALAGEKFTQNMYGNARDSAQSAIEYVFRAISITPSYTCLWKTLGDSLIFITKLPSKYSYAHIPGKLLGENTNETVYKMKADIFPVAISCYCFAVNITPFDNIPFYYDLCLAYKEFYEETEDIIYCHKAFAAAEHCVKNNPKEWEYWNLLGVIALSKAIKRDDLAQHCFVKALSCNRVSPEAWTNLGVLYLKHENHRMANKAFKRAQETDPDYLYSWIGQALIAEAVKEDEAMDLFRHSTQLGYHREAALGYAYWVCQTLQNSTNMNDPKYKYAIENMHAIPISLDLMTFVCQYEPDDPCANTILGLLQERSGLLKSASASYRRAMETCRSLKERNIVALNMGRMLLRTQQYEEAVKTLEKITEATFPSACCTALAFYRADNYDESYATYDTALHWLTSNNNEKADLLVAMAGMVYKFKGANEAKTMIFQSIQTSQTPTTHSLFALCALGLLHSDKSLSKLALSEMKRYEMDFEYSYDIGFLKSYLLIQEREYEKAFKSITNSIHMFPFNEKLWHCFAKYCLHESQSVPRYANLLVQRGSSLSGEATHVADMLSIASLSEHLCGNSKNALLLAQTAIHTHPHIANNWAAFILILIPKLMGTERKIWLRDVISHVRRRLNIPRPMGHWLGLMERLVEKGTS